MFLFIRMALYAIFGTLAGQGFEFLTFDDVTGEVVITFNLENLAAVGLGAVGFVGTFLSSYLDRLRGPFRDESGSMSAGAAILSVVGMLLLAACVTDQTEGPRLSPEQKFFEAVATYEAVKAEAAAYVSSGPLCSALDVVGCVPDRVVIAIDDVTDRFDPQIEAAALLFIGTSALSGADQQANLDLARSAIRALSQTLAATEAQS